MSDSPENYIGRLRTVALEREERAHIREELVSYMRFHPIRAHALNTAEPLRWFGWFSNAFASATLGVAMVLVLVGGVSFAAEGSVPGNSLYPVKVGFSEEVRAWFAFGDEAKATWEARRIERRLEEAETLAVAGSLSNDVRVTLATQLEAHAKAAAARLGRLASADQARVAARVSSDLESSLRAHEHILLSLEQDTSNDSESATMLIEATAKEATNETGSNTATVKIRTAGVSPLVAQVRLSIEDITAIRVQAEGGVVEVEQAVLEDEFVRAAQAIASARTVLEARKTWLDADITIEARARLALAEESFEQAEALMQDAKNAEALVELHTSIRAANEARILARTSTRTEDGEEYSEEIDPLDVLPINATSTDLTSSTTRSGQATSTKSGQGASIIDVFIDINSNTTTGTTMNGSSSESSVHVESNNNTKLQTGVNIKVNTGGL